MCIFIHVQVCKVCGLVRTLALKINTGCACSLQRFPSEAYVLRTHTISFHLSDFSRLLLSHPVIGCKVRCTIVQGDARFRVSRRETPTSHGSNIHSSTGSHSVRHLPTRMEKMGAVSRRTPLLRTDWTAVGKWCCPSDTDLLTRSSRAEEPSWYSSACRGCRLDALYITERQKNTRGRSTVHVLTLNNSIRRRAAAAPRRSDDSSDSHEDSFHSSSRCK